MLVNFDLLKSIKRPTLTSAQTNRILEVIMNDIKSRTPVDTGRLKASIRKRVIAPGKGEVYITGKRNNEVARYQHDGTEAHFIAPKTPVTYDKDGKKHGGVLAWKTGSKWHYSTGH